ncbi:MAG: phosphatase PAP2 family protein [Alphaproteobacteria bacterium]|nr:phosphatase PAP2 family protein [Alphaproteobacteria bacterium]
MTYPFAWFDLPIQHFLTGFANRSDIFDNLVYACARYDLLKGVALFSLLWFLWFHRPADDNEGALQERREKLLITFFACLVAVGIARLMQHVLTVHPRPFTADLGISFPALRDPWGNGSVRNSFPSDHAVFFFTLATGYWLVNRWVGTLALVWTAVIVGLPRIYFGIHYPSDIVFGGVLGAVCMLTANRMTSLKTGARRALLWSHDHAGTFYWLAFVATVTSTALFDDIRQMIGHSVDYLTGKG